MTLLSHRNNNNKNNKNNKNNNKNNTATTNDCGERDEEKDVVWKKVARLKTEGFPLRNGAQYHRKVRVQGNVVFTGRLDHWRSSGTVFVHKIPNEL